MKVFKFLFFFAFAFGIYAENYVNAFEVIEDRSELEILTPALVERKTAKIRLPNGLEAYLISDPSTQQSAAALAVEAGSWNDPEEYPGSAHFLEHLLFMGTETYPEEDRFIQFVKESGGKMNAYTASDRTVYMFSANNAAFEEALDRFSHFFIDPLLNTSSIERELHAVDQEHAKNIENDGWRQYMIFKETGNPNHPNAKFSTGNADTLRGIPREAIQKWYEQHYSANKMHLVIYSNLSLNELIQLTTQDFSEVPNRNVKSEAIPASMMSEAQKGHILYIKPIKDLKTLSLTWELPTALAEEQESKAGDLIAYTLKSGSKNSLLALLKRQFLAESIQVASDQIGKSKLFTIDINLTDKGLEQVDKVMIYCFETLARLKKTNIPLYIFDEVERIAQVKYQYQSKMDSFEFVAATAHTLVDEEIETYPRKTLLPTKYNPDLIKSFLDSLTPENCLFFLLADPAKAGIETHKKEKWMGAEYALHSLNPKLMHQMENASINSQIGLPPPNPYIPNDLDLIHKTVSETPIIPTLLMDNGQGKIYFAGDQKYLIPEVAHLFQLRSPLLDGTTKSIVLTDLFLKGVVDELFPLLSAAETAGAKIQLQQTHLALAVAINAYSDHSSRLTGEILSSLRKIRPSKENFDIYKQSLASEYENSEKELLFNQAQQSLKSLIFNDAPTSSEKRNALNTITYDEFVQFASNIFKKTYMEGLLYGNLTKEDGAHLLSIIKNKLKAEEFPVKDHPERSILLLSKQQGPYMVFQPTPMQGNAAILMIEQGPFSFERRACQQILATVLQNAFFDTLRTKQQVAYIAKAWDKVEENQLMQCFAVQSSTHLPNELITRFELFLENFVKQYSSELSKERFENVRKMAIATLQMPPENLLTSGLRLFTLGFEYQGDFRLIEKRIQALQKITYEDARTMANAWLSRKNTRRLAVLLEGITPKEKDFRYELVSKKDLLRDGTYVTKRETLLTDNPSDAVEIIR